MEYSIRQRGNAFSKGSLFAEDRMRMNGVVMENTTTRSDEASKERAATKATVAIEIEAHDFSASSARKRKRHTPETRMVQETRQVSPTNANVEAAMAFLAVQRNRKRTAITQNLDQKSRATTAATSSSATVPPSSTSKTQTNIRNTLRILEDYVDGSNNVDFLEFEGIPNLLFGVVGTHFQSDLGAVTLAVDVILRYCGQHNGANTRASYLRHRILRELFQKALRSGGTEHALQAIQQLGVTYWNRSKNSSGSDSSNTQEDTNMLKDAILGCWKIVVTGIRLGLSSHMYMLVVQACLADLDEIRTITKEGSLMEYFEILSSVLGVLTEALSRPELALHHLSRERNAILTNCLLLLSKACMCGVLPSNEAGKNSTHIIGVVNGEEIVTTNDTARNDDDDDDDDDGNAIPLIEDGLEILVICAQKGLLARGDFEGLVPACIACLTRFILSGDKKRKHVKNRNNAAKENGDSIPIKVVQLLEAEDATIGLWLRETYGIHPPTLIGNPNRLQHSLLSMYKMGEANGYRSTSNTGNRVQQERDALSGYIHGAVPPPNSNHAYPPGHTSPPPRPPPRMPPKARSFRTYLICDPDDTDSDEEEYFNHDEDDSQNHRRSDQ